MAHDGYLAFGGNEIINNERAFGYSRTAPEIMGWLKKTPSGRVREALGDSEYSYNNIGEAPWFDITMGDVASRFYGAYALSVKGLLDSTRTNNFTEGIDDGGEAGRQRKSVRRARVRAILLAKGEDALEYGQSWLSASLDANQCGMHSGSSCGTTDLAYFAADPPPRPSVVEYTDWVSDRVNLASNPSLETVIEPWVVLQNAGLIRSAGAIFGDYVARHVALADGNSVIAFYSSGAQGIPVTAGQPYSFSVTVRATARITPVRLYVTWRDAAGGVVQPINYPAAVTPTAIGDHMRIGVTEIAPPGAVFAQVAMQAPEALAGDEFQWDGLLVEQSGTLNDYFDGNSESTLDVYGNEIVMYEWDEDPEVSTSVRSTRASMLRPETDEEWENSTIGELRRYLHGVATVSGPFEIERMESRGFHGLVVEFTIAAGRPWVFGETRTVDLPTTNTVVMQDTPFNLVTVPSAEVAAAGEITVMRNLSTNPSLEVNATGWSGLAMAGMGTVVTGRITGELSANGTASFRNILTTTGAGADGYMLNDHTVMLALPHVGQRYSISMWGAAVVMTGTPVIGTIRFTALWMNGATQVGSTYLGEVDSDGGSVSVQSLVPPANADRVTVRSALVITSWASGNVIRLYGDAVAVTNP